MKKLLMLSMLACTFIHAAEGEVERFVPSLKSLAAFKLADNANIPEDCKAIVDEAKKKSLPELKQFLTAKLKNAIVRYQTMFHQFNHFHYNMQNKSIKNICTDFSFPTSFYDKLIKSGFTGFSVQDLLDCSQNIVVNNSFVCLDNYNISSLEGLNQIPNIARCRGLSVEHQTLFCRSNH